MKYTSSEALTQVLVRRDRLRKKRDQRQLSLLSLSLFAVLLVLSLTVTSAPLPPQEGGDGAVMGSFLLEARTGGFVAAVVLAFLLGVLITLLCIRKHQQKGNKIDPQDPKHNENGGIQP